MIVFIYLIFFLLNEQYYEVICEEKREKTILGRKRISFLAGFLNYF